MRVEIKADTRQIGSALEKQGYMVRRTSMGDVFIEGDLESLIEAVTKALTIKVNNETALVVVK